jgi:hypothetical protein
MQSTGQASTRELSLVPMHGSAMTYVTVVSASGISGGERTPAVAWADAGSG